MSTERREPHGATFVVGVVGRTGSGKSTVARALGRDGAVVIDADALGHEITDHDPEVRAALAAEYGPEVYRTDGTLDRPRVASRVFHDPEALRRLDALVHPRIVERIRGRLDEATVADASLTVVIDAALLLDWGLERWCDAVIAVEAPEGPQIERLVASRGWSPEHARRRWAAQRSPAEFRSAADVTLDNRGTPEELEATARAVVADLRARRAAARREQC